MPTTPQRDLEHELTVPLTVREAGDGRPMLVLHGGAGPASVDSIVDHYASDYRVLLPIHPGWEGTARSRSFDTVAVLASTYLDLLDALDLRDVVVLGSSYGGRIATEMSIRDTDRLGRLVLLDAIGPKPRPDQLAPPATSKPSRPADGPSAADLALLQSYTGPAMYDSELLARVKDAHTRTLVLWGKHDPIVTTSFGRGYADAFPDARFQTIAGAGHLPTQEAPHATFAAIDRFLAS